MRHNGDMPIYKEIARFTHDERNIIEGYRSQGFDTEAYATRLDPASDKLESLGISPETLTAWKAGYASSGILRNRLALPLHRGGAIVGYFGVALDKQEPGLLFPNGLAPADYIFGAHQAAQQATKDTLCLLQNPEAVLKAGALNIPAVCFFTDTVSTAQLLALCAFMELLKREELEIA
jgi:hypothetical protein